MTIRAVATAVGAPPMSLYSHFANKEELLDLMYAEVAARAYADGEHSTWQVALTALCHQVRGVLLEHPHWIPLLSRPAAPLAVPLRERILLLMSAAGFAPEEALTSITNASLISFGLAMVELSFREAGGGSALTKRFERLRSWTAQTAFAKQHPVTRSAFAKMRRLDLDSTFESAIGAFVKGVEAGSPGAR